MLNSKFILTAVCSALFASSAFAAGSCGAPAEVKASRVLPAKTPSASSSFNTLLSSEKQDRNLFSKELKEAVQNFETRYPKTRVLAFSLTPMQGLFEAAVGKEVVYFDKTARFVFSGRLLDMDRGEDLTDKRLKDLRRISFKSLPLDLAVKTVYGNGKRKVAVFTDVDCPFSRKLAGTLESLKDTTVYTFLFPLESIHPQARGKSDAVWCSKNPSAALASALKGEATAKPIANNPVCPSPVNAVLELAQKHGISGTPTLINEAGDRISGALPLEKLEEFIAAGAPKAASETKKETKPETSEALINANASGKTKVVTRKVAS